MLLLPRHLVIVPPLQLQLQLPHLFQSLRSGQAVGKRTRSTISSISVVLLKPQIRLLVLTTIIHTCMSLPLMLTANVRLELMILPLLSTSLTAQLTKLRLFIPTPNMQLVSKMDLIKLSAKSRDLILQLHNKLQSTMTKSAKWLSEYHQLLEAQIQTWEIASTSKFGQLRVLTLSFHLLLWLLQQLPITISENIYFANF